ncbi:hypothetical protein ACFQL9_13220 [Halobaculum lipolyticum]|uniref:Restriction endonuclease n=1 Tax=Halobaculum lipolyticum TaxID=3032001 RepID=A0ABD5WFU3_9EURY
MTNKPEKPEKEAIVEAVAEYLTGYLGDVTDIDSFARNLDPQTNIRGLDDIVRYHFLRTGEWDPQTRKTRYDFDIDPIDTADITGPHGNPIGILDFISLLPSRLRSLDPAVKQTVEITHGEVRGQIDWQETIKHRSRTGDTGTQTFACRVQERTTLSLRNRVLFALLGAIQSTYEQFGEEVVTGDTWPDWFEGWGPEGEYRAELNRILQTPYFRDVKFDSITVTNREVAEVRSDRDQLYREAATLLAEYRRLGSDWIDESDTRIRSLLSMDLFYPTEENREGSDVFELYWIFRLLDRMADGTRLESFTGDSKTVFRGELIAHWEDDESEYLLFNDWEGGYPYEEGIEKLFSINFSYFERDEYDNVPEMVESYPTRRGFVNHHERWIQEDAFGKDAGAGEKTPDIVLLKLDVNSDTPVLQKVFIGEVKHSIREQEIQEGITQILEYGAFAKVGEDMVMADDPERTYVTSSPDPLRSPELELGLFIGSDDLVESHEIPGIQIVGWEDNSDEELDAPFEKT